MGRRAAKWDERVRVAGHPWMKFIHGFSRFHGWSMRFVVFLSTRRVRWYYGLGSFLWMIQGASSAAWQVTARFGCISLYLSFARRLNLFAPAPTSSAFHFRVVLLWTFLHRSCIDPSRLLCCWSLIYLNDDPASLWCSSGGARMQELTTRTILEDPTLW